MKALLSASAALAAIAIAASAAAQTPQPRLNQIQVIGTHNSYSQPADPRVFSVMKPMLQPMLDRIFSSLPAEAMAVLRDEHPNAIFEDLQSGLEYIHPPIEAQLRAGLRSLEFDLNVDHEGGRFSNPLPYRILREQGAKDLAPLYDQALAQPGLKVMHAVDVDFRSHCPTFRLCLQQVRAWSDANPGHSPVFILLEPKFQSLAAFAPGATPLDPFDARAFAEMDASIAEIIGRERVITPDDVRGDHATLEAAALDGGWPTLEAARGKIVFLMIVPGLNLATFAPYMEGHPNLEGRMAFVQGRPGMPHAAFVMIDNVLTHSDEIRDLVSRGYLVRTRSDIDTGEARTNDVTRRDAALASGAQIISTDYPFAPNIFANDYVVKPFPGGSRANPVSSPRSPEGGRGR
ncbi:MULTISPECIES: Ca2+-dependent phosphoinositide-specific phospholipase C [unclassified Brevundimonas]|uniref:Ca2+-dependent phosphoinositide-specific phospholipase C n=1 Tax=unclassified Brevundimonas TaxID=2622653 RepID=UPI0025C53A93|nr:MULTISPECIES: Ca2+-dependent phosphoinositide-specific phospholipase C [unclassified Brevundimonas]